MVATPEFKRLAKRIVTDARVLAKCFADKGYTVLTGGSDNHIVLINVLASGVTGVIAERALEECNIIVNKNRISGDKKSALITSGVRLGTNSLALRGMGGGEMPQCADLIDQVLASVKVLSETEYELDETIRESVQAEVKRLCACFPIPRYPIESREPQWTDEKSEAYQGA